MDGYSIYKKYLFYLISPQRNTRNCITYNNVYIPSPLSKCINAKDIHLLYLSDSSDSDSFGSSDSSDSIYSELSDKDSVENFIVIGEDDECDESEPDIFQFDDNFHIED